MVRVEWHGTISKGRPSRNIELYEWSLRLEEKGFAPQAWVLRKVLQGPVHLNADSLASAFAYRDPKRFYSSVATSSGNATEPLNLWGLRLFTSGAGAEILEWDLWSEPLISDGTRPTDPVLMISPLALERERILSKPAPCSAPLSTLPVPS